jgi:hypothetical protein
MSSPCDDDSSFVLTQLLFYFIIMVSADVCGLQRIYEYVSTIMAKVKEKGIRRKGENYV